MDVPAVRELAGPPRLAPLFARAGLGLLPAFRRRVPAEPTLPAAGLARSGVRVDRAHLAAYDRVCGFRLSDELPVTYPHVPAFGPQTALMAGADFPFPMIGLVHIADRIAWTRPLRADEPLVVRVHAENLRPHARGARFDLVSVALADGEPVWIEHSTYLRRGSSSRSPGRTGSVDSDLGSVDPDSRAMDPDPRSADAALPVVAPEAVWRVPGDTGRRYAHVSGDHNPIHLYPLSAKLFGFPRAIAHGMWSLARCLAFFEEGLPAAGIVDVRFTRPILLPATVALSTATVTDSSTAVADGVAATGVVDGVVPRAAGGAARTFALVDHPTGKPHLSGTITPAH